VTHLYIERIEEMVQQGIALPIRPGSQMTAVLVTHEPWCAVWIGDECDCRVEVVVRDGD